MVSVYAMLASKSDTALHLLIHDQDFSQWMHSGFPMNPPKRVHGFWQSDEDIRLTEFPSFSQWYPVLSKRVVDAVRASFEPYGHFIPVDIRNEGTGSYELYVPDRLVDCLDRAHSSDPEGWLEIIQRVVFIPERVPRAVPAFRIPESRDFVFWNEWAAKKVIELVGEADIEVRLVWSNTPGATPHPDPMNI